jgi:hypothetical protein
VAVEWGDAGDAVGVPDVRVDLSLDVLELVKLVDPEWSVFYYDVADFLEGIGIAKPEDSGAVAGDDLGCCMGHAPALAGVGEAPDLSQTEAVVDEADVRFPGPLVEVRTPIDYALAEELLGQVEPLDGFSGFGLGHCDCGVAV